MKSVVNKLSLLNIAIVSLICVASFSFMWFYFYDKFNFFFNGNIVLILLYAVLLEILMVLTDGYEFKTNRIRDILFSQILALLISYAFIYVQISLMVMRFFDLVPMLVVFVGECLLLIGWNFAFHALVNSKLPQEKMLLVADQENISKIQSAFQRHSDRYKIRHTVTCDKSFQNIARLVDKVDSVILVNVPLNLRHELISYIYENKKTAYIVPDVSDILLASASAFNLIDTPIFFLNNYCLSPVQAFVKRLMDIVVSLLCLIVASPIMLITAFAIKIQDRGPVFYKQERLTQGYRKFNLIKFRSMSQNAEKDGVQRLSAVNDSRVTGVGRFIRKTRIDEIPQFLNIFKGDMSFIGPRPERPEISAQYEEEFPEFRYRTNVKAGLTGLAQIKGKYNTTPFDKLRFDLIYIQTYSVRLDIIIFLQTIPILFKGEATEGVSENQTTALK